MELEQWRKISGKINAKVGVEIMAVKIMIKKLGQHFTQNTFSILLLEINDNSNFVRRS